MHKLESSCRQAKETSEELRLRLHKADKERARLRLESILQQIDKAKISEVTVSTPVVRIRD